MEQVKPITILLVEDDLGHARLVEKNLRRANIMNEIILFGNGQELIDFLFHSVEYEPSALKERLLILLDLNMPVMDGYEALRRIKAYEPTKYIPVIILTTTYDTAEIARCYELGCNVYIAKPVDYEQFSEVINRLGLFLSIVAIPKGA